MINGKVKASCTLVKVNGLAISEMVSRTEKGYTTMARGASSKDLTNKGF